MNTIQLRIHRPRASLLLTLLLGTPAFAQDERPPISIPQPERRLATPASGSPLTVVQVNYKYAVKERDYLSLAVQELVSFTRISTQLEVPLHSRTLTLDDPRIADALMLYMTGFDCSMRIDEQEKQGLAHYLRSGGLLFAEDILPLEANLRGSAGVAGTPFDRQFKALLKDPQVLGSDGRALAQTAQERPPVLGLFRLLRWAAPKRHEPGQRLRLGSHRDSRAGSQLSSATSTLAGSGAISTPKAATAAYSSAPTSWSLHWFKNTRADHCPSGAEMSGWQRRVPPQFAATSCSCSRP